MLMMVHMMSYILLFDDSCGGSISGLLVGAEEGGLCLVDLKFFCYWAKWPLEVARLLGRYLEIRCVVSSGQPMKLSRYMACTSVDTIGLKSNPERY